MSGVQSSSRDAISPLCSQDPVINITSKSLDSKKSQRIKALFDRPCVYQSRSDFLPFVSRQSGVIHMTQVLQTHAMIPALPPLHPAGLQRPN